MDIIVNQPRLLSSSKYLYFSNGKISESSTLDSLPVTKISISSIQIEPLKRIASFTISFWASNKPNDNSIFLGQKSYNSNSTYTVPIINPTIFSLTSFQTSPEFYTISIKDNSKNNVCTFTSLFPYYDINSDLYVYYNPNTPWEFTGPTGINMDLPGLSFSKVDKYTTSSSDINSIDLWYTTPNGIQYLRTNVAGTNLKPKGTIKYLYSTDPNKITGTPSVTMDSIHPYQFNMPVDYCVRSELQTNSQSSYTITLNGYTNSIQTSNIPVIGPKGLQGKFNNFNFYNQLITGPSGTTGTYSSAQFLDYTLYTGYTGVKNLQNGSNGLTGYYYTGYSGTTGYRLANLKYTPNISNTTVIIPSVIVSDISDPTIIQYYSNPLNSNDIGIMDSSYSIYNSILSMLQSTGPTGSFINTILEKTLNLSEPTTVGMSGSILFVNL